MYICVTPRSRIITCCTAIGTLGAVSVVMIENTVSISQAYLRMYSFYSKARERGQRQEILGTSYSLPLTWERRFVRGLLSMSIFSFSTLFTTMSVNYMILTCEVFAKRDRWCLWRVKDYRYNWCKTWEQHLRSAEYFNTFNSLRPSDAYAPVNWATIG